MGEIMNSRIESNMCSGKSEQKKRTTRYTKMRFLLIHINQSALFITEIKGPTIKREWLKIRSFSPLPNK